MAFAGSLRKDSYNKRVVKTAIEGAKKAGAEVTYIDLEDYPMPVYNADDHAANGFPENALKLQKLFAEHDGFLIASPEYNGSVPGGLKNAIDWASRKSENYGMIEVFKGKAAAMKGILHELGASLVDTMKKMHGDFEVVEGAGQFN
ncbi:MAG: NADPH-dependent FMN reductase [Pyrinomonadaceae bacterium]